MKKTILLFVFVLFSAFMVLESGVSQAAVVLNEIFSKGSDTNLDWIEIYNGSAEQVDVSGYKIYDSAGQAGTKTKKEFPAGTVIPANGFFVIVTDDTSASGFGLSSSGEEVWLEDATGAVIDNVVFPTLQATQTYGRIPDGGAWKVLDIITRGTSNSLVKMNEVFSRGTDTDPDWIELYNGSTEQMDLSGYKIYDSGGQTGEKPKKEIPAGTVMLPNSFLVIVTDDTAASAFGLSNKGDEVWLEDATGTVVDNVLIPALADTESYGRIPDGGIWQILTTITRGLTNVVVSDELVKMNEIFSRGSDPDLDWIEIYNGAATPIDISGYKIYDDAGQAGTKPKKEFPAGTVIPANGFLVIVTDDTSESGFGLSSNGEEVWLENTAGKLIDNVDFPALEKTQSYGRVPDGGEWKIMDTITRGFSNTATGIKHDIPVVNNFVLNQNYPNPFNPTTNIQFELPKAAAVKLAVYSITGQLVAELVNEKLTSGSHSIQFDATGLSSGVYIYSISSENFVSSKKMMVIK